MFSAPGKLIGSIGSAASSVLGTGNETPADMGPAAGEPFKLPTIDNIEKSIGDGISEAR